MNKFKNILLLFNEGSKNDAAIYRAKQLFKMNKGHLTVVSVLNESTSHFDSIFDDTTKEQAKQIMQENLIKKMKRPFQSLAKGKNITFEVLQGKAYLEVIKYVHQNNIDLVIATAEVKSKFKEMIFGSTTMHLMRKCPCPVLVAKPIKKRKYFRVLAAVKISDYQKNNNYLNNRIMEIATSLVDTEQVEVHVCVAWSIYGEQFLRDAKQKRQVAKDIKKMIKLQVDMLLKKYEFAHENIHVHLRKGEASRVITTVAKKEKIDLLVMGSLSRTGIAGYLIGNTAEEVLQQIDCSVLTLKPESFYSPVIS